MLVKRTKQPKARGIRDEIRGRHRGELGVCGNIRQGSLIGGTLSRIGLGWGGGLGSLWAVRWGPGRVVWGQARGEGLAQSCGAHKGSLLWVMGLPWQLYLLSVAFIKVSNFRPSTSSHCVCSPRALPPAAG